MCFLKPTICMVSYEFYVTSQPLLMTSQDCIHDITSTLFMTPYPLYMTCHTLYLWHQSHCYYDKIPTMFLTLYSVYMTSQTVNEWQHNDCIWHYTHCICVIKPIWLMTSHHMYVWSHTHCMHETRDILCDIASTLVDNTTLFVCHGTHSVYEIICTIYVVTHIVCIITKALYLAWDLLNCHLFHSVCNHTLSVEDITPTV